MNRRAFLGLFGAGTAAFVMDPERLLWRSGAKTIFLPPVAQFSGNSLMTPEWVTNEIARMFQNEVKFLANANKRYDEQYVNSGQKMRFATGGIYRSAS